MAAHPVAIAWVLVEGQIRNVSEFAQLSPGKRPRAFCPACGEAVTLKLGNIRVHHAAHHANFTCVLTKPETAMHFNVKHHIAELLKNHSHLKIAQTCSGYLLECTVQHGIQVFNKWDTVGVEVLAGPYLLDVGVKQNGHIIGAIEIQVTHKTEEEKIKYFMDHGMDWIELKVTKENYEEIMGWAPDRLLQKDWIVGSSVTTVDWICKRCEAEKTKDAREDDRLKEKNKQIKKSLEEVRCVKFVDIYYYSSGKRFRQIYRIKEITNSDGRTQIALYDVSWDEIFRRDVPWSRTILNQIDSFLDDHHRKGKYSEAIIDSPMNWQVWPEGQHTKVVLFGEVFPPRYEWDGRTWTMITGSQSICWDQYWSDKPKYMREIQTLASANQVPIYPNRPRSDRRIKRISQKLESVKTSSLSAIEESSIKSKGNEFPCQFCGRITDDYWYVDLKINTCKCRKCYRKGKY